MAKPQAQPAAEAVEASTISESVGTVISNFKFTVSFVGLDSNAVVRETDDRILGQIVTHNGGRVFFGSHAPIGAFTASGGASGSPEQFFDIGDQFCWIDRIVNTRMPNGSFRTRWEIVFGETDVAAGVDYSVPTIMAPMPKL